eukprot:TRINITY_DN35665_c0_g1_i1.p1 TRINITY_DN35665_c0_g1~~TRINITY_DN35665_c0_g1_i1.p1  ORF type:complete len:428 (+),score=130.98 TRINITY_DN35665_c0_g1_i1:54-1286(+)
MGCGRSSALPAGAVAVGPVSGFADCTAKRVAVGGRAVAVFRVRGRFYALDDACAHRGASLSLGDIEDAGAEPCVACPWHGCRVVIATGGRLLPDGGGGGCVRQRSHRTFVSVNTVYVELDESGEAESDRWARADLPLQPRSPHSRAMDCRAHLIRKAPACQSGSMCTFELAVEPRQSPPLFRPGQYGVFELPAGATAGTVVGGRRHFSLHSGADGALAFSVKRRVNGSVSVWLHRCFDEGASLRLVSIGGAFGLFAHGGPQKVLMIAVGAGITPLYSQLQAVFGPTPHPDAAALSALDAVLLYGERDRADLAFTHDLDRWEADLRHSPSSANGHSLRKLSVHYSLTQPDAAWGGLSGRITAASVTAVCSDVAERAVQLCGPASWRRQIVPRLVSECGVPPGSIAQEDFDL